jgi:hypothetical protein
MNTGLARGTLPIDLGVTYLTRLPPFVAAAVRGGLFLFPSMSKSPRTNFSLSFV